MSDEKKEEKKEEKKPAGPPPGGPPPEPAIKLPKVGDMAKFLAQFDNESDIKTLMARDSRKTAQASYEVR